MTKNVIKESRIKGTPVAFFASNRVLDSVDKFSASADSKIYT